ncbi:MAG: DEAD/DEAH box helicase [Fusobacteriaceae bacterium]
MSDFKSLKISDKYLTILKKKGIKSPTEIQNLAIPFIKDGKDVIGEASTGSGKTFAYLLPILDELKIEKSRVSTLILVPTRELAIQVKNEIDFLDEEKKYKLALIYGGRESGRGQESSDIVVATPGRLIELIEKNLIDLSKIQTLVLDEADQMILLGFKNEVEKILAKVSKKRQTLCFSATLNSEVKKMAYRYTNEAKLIVVQKDEDAIKKIKQYVVETTDRRKIDILCKMINEDNPFMGIIFCRTKARVDKLDERLHEKGYSCQKIHSDIPQAKREKIMKSFKNLEVQFLIATDVVARGIDVDGVTHIYNYDVPENGEGYVHRIGRTGRAGNSGKAYTLIDPKDSSVLKTIEEEIGFSILRREVEYVQNIENENELPKTKYDKRINVSSKKIEAIKITKKRASFKK